MVKDLLENMEAGVFHVLIKHVEPSGEFAGVKIPEITNWRFCDVMALMSDSSPLKMMKLATGLDERSILKADEKQFTAAIAHLLNEVKKIEALEEKLKEDPDVDLMSAGIEQLNMFGPVAIYSAINPDPRFWDEISEIPYHKMWTKLMLDKTNKNIQKEYDRIIQEKQKQNVRR